MVTGEPTRGVMIRVPAEPRPWPTTLMAIVAMPRLANIAATASGAPCLLSVNPCPKIATGQPPAGVGPAGMIKLNSRVLVPWATGTPVRVPIGGVKFFGVFPSGGWEVPQAAAPTPGAMPRARNRVDGNPTDGLGD